MLRSIQKLIGDKRKQLIFPIFLMSLDAIGSLVMYLMLYFTVIHLLNGSLTGGLVRNYTIVCLISVILRLIIYRSGYFLCFSRGAEMCSGLRLDLANHYRSLSLGYFNQNSSGYLLSTLTKDLSNFELVLTHTLPSIVKTLVMGCLILVGTFFINWKLALAECVVILIALPVLNWGNRLVEKYGTIKRDLTSKMISIVLEYIKGMKVFKSANMTSTHFTRMSDTLEDIRKTSVQAEVKTAAPTSMYSIIANFLLPFVLLVGSYLFLGGTIASELLVAFMLMSLALSALLIAFEHSYNLLKELKLATSTLNSIIDFFGIGNIKAKFPAYKQGTYFMNVINQFESLFFEEYVAAHGVWNLAIENFRGDHSVPIMTIHKSKGLEYNAVYFIGLEDSAFWNFRNQPDEDRCTFFVALSRAKASVTFTFCKKRTGMKCPMQRHNAINEFFDLLQRPGIAEVKRFQNR